MARNLRLAKRHFTLQNAKKCEEIVFTECHATDYQEEFTPKDT